MTRNSLRYALVLSLSFMLQGCSTVSVSPQDQKEIETAFTLIQEHHLYLEDKKSVLQAAYDTKNTCDVQETFSIPIGNDTIQYPCTRSLTEESHHFAQSLKQQNQTLISGLSHLLQALDPYSSLVPISETQFLFKETEPSVFSAHAGSYATIRIDEFRQNTSRELEQAVKDTMLLHGNKLDGIILDIRGNSGGLIDQAATSADLFLPPNHLLFLYHTRNPLELKEYHSNGSDLTRQAPLFLLVDENTASAAEIFAASLIRQKRAILLGQATKGKGLSQTIYDFTPQTSLFLTTGFVTLPENISYNGRGLHPQYCALFSSRFPLLSCQENTMPSYPEMLKMISFLHNSPLDSEKLLKKQKQSLYSQ